MIGLRKSNKKLHFEEKRDRKDIHTDLTKSIKNLEKTVKK